MNSFWIIYKLSMKTDKAFKLPVELDNIKPKVNEK